MNFFSHGRAVARDARTVFLFYLSSHYHFYFLKNRIIFYFLATIAEMTLFLGSALLWFSFRVIFAVSKSVDFIRNYARVVADMWELHQSKNLLLIDNAHALIKHIQLGFCTLCFSLLYCASLMLNFFPLKCSVCPPNSQ